MASFEPGLSPTNRMSVFLDTEPVTLAPSAVSLASACDAARALLARSHPAVVALGSGRGLDVAVASAEQLTRAKPRYH